MLIQRFRERTKHLRNIALVCTTFALVFSGTSWAISGNDWREAPQAFKDGYMMGVIHAWLEELDIVESYRTRSPDIGSPPLEPLAMCIRQRKMPYTQTKGIVEKHMSDNPNKWDSPMARIVWLAMVDTCKDLSER